MQRMGMLFICFLLCVLLLGCQGSSSLEQAAASPAGGDSLDTALPWPSTQASSILTETLLDGVDVYAKSANAVEQGTALELGSAPEGFEWAIYRFNPGTECLDSAAVLLDIPAGYEAWLGLPDYTQGAWSFNGPYSASKTLAVDDASYQSPGGELYLAVIVHGGNSVLVESLSVRTTRPDNEAPWADLTVDQQAGEAPLTVGFDASGSVDPDGELYYFMWDFDGDGNFEGKSFNAEVDHVYTEPGLFTATVAVIDDLGAWATDAVEINIGAAGNSFPVADLTANPASGDAPLVVTLDASGSSDEDGSIVKYEWDFEGDGAYDSYGSGATIDHTYADAGVYTAKLRVTDDAGVQDTDTAEINASVAGNESPTASLSAAPPSGYAPLTVVLDASASSDPDGSIARYDYDFDSDGIWDAYDSTNSITHTYTSTGIFTGKVRVTDDAGAQDTAVAEVSVNVGGNDPPVAVLAADKTSGYTPCVISFDASESNDSDGVIVSYEWDVDGDGNYDMYGADNLDHTYTKWGFYQPTVRVTDDCGAQSIAQLGISLPTPWWMYGMNARHTGCSPYVGAQTSNVKWNKLFNVPDINASPVIGADQNIYMCVCDINPMGFRSKLYAFSPEGNYLWIRNYWGTISFNTPAIGNNGLIYITVIDMSTQNSILMAIDASGDTIWTCDIPDNVYSSPAIGVDGTIYVGSYDHRLYAISASGNVKWSCPTTDEINSSPAIGVDGTIYVGSNDNRIYAITPEGAVKWYYETGDWVSSSPAIGEDGTIYVGSMDNKLYALNRDGTLKWTYTTSNSIQCSPAIGPDDCIYFVGRDDVIYAIYPNGALKWSVAESFTLVSALAIGSDGTIYINDYESPIKVYNPDGTVKWSYTTSGHQYSTPVIGIDGTVYIARNQSLYAFGPSS